MEVILDCYFNSIFCDLERASLLSKYKRRQLCEYFKTVIEGCAAAEQCSPQDGCRHAVTAALRKHDDTRTDNGQVCLLGKFHNVLYVAAKLCYDFRLDDPPLVARVLRDIYQCERTFERLFAGAIFGIRVSHFIAGWKSDFENETENISALAYFLESARKSRLRFAIGGRQVRRFVDVPMTSLSNSSPLRVACQVPRPEVALLLLRYGAAAKFDRGDGSSSSHIEPLLTQLADGAPYPPPVLDCLSYLLRAMPSISRLPPTLEELQHFEVSERLFLEPDMLQILPASRLGYTPPELKHLCRSSIRSVLWSNWQLPSGIQKLKLPHSLAAYIDLQQD